jgi:parvulin-like peptidyl-prolyl isomerase
MKTITLLCPVAFGLASLSLAQDSQHIQPGQPKPPAEAAESVPADAVVLTVGDEKITRAQFELLLAALPENVRTAGKRKIAEQLMEVKAMALECRKRKLDETPTNKPLIALQIDNALAGILYKQISTDTKVDDVAVRAYFDSHKSEYEQATASHILIRFQGSRVELKPGQKDLSMAEALAKAQALRAKLVAGADFAALAKAESDDTASGAQGGSLGTFGHGDMVGEFETVAFTLPVGQISEPVKTQFGYHLIKVDARTPKTFDKVRPDIEKTLKPKLAQEQIDGIRKQTPTSLSDAYFGK